MNVILYKLTKPATVGETGALELSTNVDYVAVAAKRVPVAVRLSFLLFVFTLPFEAMDLGFMTGSMSISKIAGFLFFMCYLFYHNGLFSKRSFPRLQQPMWWLLVFLVVYTLNGLLLGPPELEYLRELVGSLFQLAQIFVIFWIGSDVLKDERTARNVLLGFAIAASLFGIGIVLRIPGFAIELAQGRASAIGDNPNAIAANSAVAIVTILGLLFYTSYNKLFLVALSVPLLGAIISSGSRGGVLALLAGCLVYLVSYGHSKGILLKVILFTALVASSVVYFVANNSDFSERWQETYYEGSLEGREDIFSAAAEMILEKPIVGWQPINWTYELGRRMGGAWATRGRDAHNFLLAVFLQVGIIGVIPYVISLWFCGWSAWRARTGSLSLMPLALVITMFAVGMSSELPGKVSWVIFALAVAAASYTGSPKRFARVKAYYEQSTKKRTFYTPQPRAES